MATNDETSSGEAAHVHTWRTLIELDLSGEPGSEHRLADRVAEAVQGLEWPAAHLERLKLASARAVLNALERSRMHESEALPVIRVLVPQSSRPARAADQASTESTQSPAASGQIQQSGQAPSHGWGFFLVEKSGVSPGRGEVRHVIELFLYQEGEKRGSNGR